MNTAHRKALPGTKLDYFDARAAVDAIQPGAYDKLPYTSRVLAENLVRRCDPATLDASLSQLIERKRDLDFPWFPARVVCHDILGQTALVDLAGLRDAIAAQGGDPSQVNPVVPVQLVVDHSLAVECGARARKPMLNFNVEPAPGMVNVLGPAEETLGLPRTSRGLDQARPPVCFDTAVRTIARFVWALSAAR